MFLMRKVGSCGDSWPALDESFLFMLPGWRAESTLGGFIMILPHVAAERRQTENGDLSGGRSSPPGSVVMFDPRIPGEGHQRWPLPGGDGC